MFLTSSRAIVKLELRTISPSVYYSSFVLCASYVFVNIHFARIPLVFSYFNEKSIEVERKKKKKRRGLRSLQLYHEGRVEFTHRQIARRPLDCLMDPFSFPVGWLTLLSAPRSAAVSEATGRKAST